MPIYNYQCKNPECGEAFEKRAKIEERDLELEPCITCLAEVERVTSLPSPPQFVGSGFTPKFYPNK